MSPSDQKDHSTDEAAEALEAISAPQPDPEPGFAEVADYEILWVNPVPVVYRNLSLGLHSFAGLLRRQRWRLTAFVALVIAAELAVQWAAPEYANRVYDDRFTGGFAIEMSASGTRGPSVTPDKPEGVVRIVAMGDSVTFGAGVAESATWPRQLEAELAERLGRPVEVINAALPAVDLAQVELLLRAQWARYRPDAVAVMLSGNMVSLGWIRRDHETEPPPNPYLDPPTSPEGIARVVAKGKRSLQRLALPGFLKINVERVTYWAGLNDHRIDPDEPYGLMLAHGWRQPDVGPGMIEGAWGVASRQLGRLAETTESLNVPIVLAYSVPRFLTSDSPFDNLKAVPKERLMLDPTRKAEDLCDGRAVPCADMLTPFRETQQEGSLYVLADYTHLNERGNAVVAKAFADLLTPLVIAPSGE